MSCDFPKRRSTCFHLDDEFKKNGNPLSSEDLAHFERLDLIYRSLCAMMFNYVPTSGHPGGSISSGHFVSSLLFNTLSYDFSDPDRGDADIISYAAGHKALGLYAMWALRNEIVRIAAPELLPENINLRLRLEDLLGFRRNPVSDTPLFKKFSSKALDGHPCPITPFIRLSTGASGVGVTTSLGLAFGARDYYGPNAPKVHLVEGEAGLTPGRVAEAMAAAGTACLDNVIMHLDWNQASIDSNRVCLDETGPGDYVQWAPGELAQLHDWNLISVPDGTNFQQIIAAHKLALSITNGQPTMIAYHTTKGWKYGIEGKASHGGGHKYCSEGFFKAIEPLTRLVGETPRSCEGGSRETIEESYWQALQIVRKALETNRPMVDAMAARLRASRARLDSSGRKPRENAPTVDTLYEIATRGADQIPDGMAPAVGTGATLRGELGKVLGHYNEKSGGAMLAAAADLLGSTSINKCASAFDDGFWNARSNPLARLLSLGGICEDAMVGILTGISSYGRHIGVGSSYGAFIAALSHISSRLHAIGCQGKYDATGDAFKTAIVVCAHAGLKTGEDGPTHADPQPLQLLQGNFPKGSAITLTPWDPGEVWTLFSAGLAQRPAVLFPFVTRPTEKVFDREAMGLAPVSAARTGVYALRSAEGDGDGTVVLQGSGVTYAFLEDALPRLEKAGVDLNIYYVASEELFDALSPEEKEDIFPAAHSEEAMGITGFTLPTMYRWIRSDAGREATMYPFQKGHYLGSGQADMVLDEAGLDGASQARAVLRYLGRD